MITEMVKEVGGDVIEVEGLMGSGIDPHLYKASEGDVTKIAQADLIFYNGLHLEGKLVEVFEKMDRTGIQTVAVGEVINKNKLIGSEYFASNFDPHIWFNIEFWQQCTDFVALSLADKLPQHRELFLANAEAYKKKLADLQAEIKAEIDQLPKEKRILITAHDAFNYFGQAFDFEVIGLQGLSTATEAGVKDVQRLSDVIVSRKIKAIFVESSVPRKTIEALQEAVKAKGEQVAIGGTLYSDALGTKNTQEGTYVGMYRHNVNTIVNALNQ
ncbi:zinc ABC transporter substrate-binding protein [Gangjinia marincola]|uniref:Zinc ABC transporter substrate-binding protein n=2 Tax=Gangjinia marincola TaxID=578463 RepID=A0ABP3XXY2_9FLAO